MDEHNYLRNGQIPPFGNWEHANDLPITQYFECARDAGLLRYSSSSGESELHSRKHGDLYAIPEKKASRSVAPTRKTSGLEKRSSKVKEQGKQGTKPDQIDQRMPRKQRPAAQNNYKLHNDAAPCSHPHSRTKPTKAKAKVIAAKAIDEDLYKIPPHLLHTTKRKKVMGFFSRCLVPDCKA